MAKVNVVLSGAQAEALVKALTTQVKDTKTIQVITAKVQGAIGVAV